MTLGQHSNYRRDVDGLRALAILPVVIYHAFPTWLPGGFLGVDVFFVISGYLISRILFKDLENQRFSLTDFYLRRIRRIFPALLTVMCFCLGFAWFALMANEFKQLGKHIAAGATFVSNLVLWKEVGYFDNSAETKPLLHLWSLSVEEQFYLVWPVLLWFAWKVRINLLGVALVLISLSFGLNLEWAHQNPSASFYFPQARFWELLSGSVLAWISVYRKPLQQKTAVTSVGVLLLCLGFWKMDKSMGVPNAWTLVPVLGTLFILAGGQDSWINRNILANPVLVRVGLISYPLYLWHWPLLAFARVLESETPSGTVRALIVVLSVFLAWVTFQCVEKPIRFSSASKIKTKYLIGSMVCMCALGLLVQHHEGFSFRNKVIEQNLIQNEYEKSFYQNQIAQKNFPSFSLNLEERGLYSYQSRDAAPTVMLLGDSFANRLIMGLVKQSKNTFLHLGRAGCPGFLGVSTQDTLDGPEFCREVHSRAVTIAENTQSIHTIIFYNRGHFYLSKDAKRFIYVKDHPEIKTAEQVMEYGIRQTFARFSRSNKNLIFAFANPDFNRDPLLCTDSRPFRLTKRTLPKCENNRAEFDAYELSYRKMMNRILADFPLIKVLDIPKLLCDQQVCHGVIDGKVLYSDGTHLSLSGSELVAERLAPLIAKDLR